MREDGQRLIREVMTQLNRAARVYYWILKLARMIADLTGSNGIQSAHLVDVLHFHPPDDLYPIVGKASTWQDQPDKACCNLVPDLWRSAGK